MEKGRLFQIKKQNKIQERQLNVEVEIGNISEKELTIMIVKITQDLGKGMENMQRRPMLIKELKNQTEINNTLENCNNRITKAEE